MEIRFFDKTLAFLGISDGAVKVTAEEKALGTGVFTAVIPLGDAAGSFAAVGGHIITDNGTAYTIERVIRDETCRTLTLYAVEIMEVLRRSVISTPKKFTGSPGEIIAGIVSKYSVSPVSVVHSGTGAATVWCASLGLLYDELKDISEAFSLTYRMTIENGALVLTVNGVNDRTSEVVLSDEFGTADIIAEKKDISNYANVAVIFGESTAQSAPLIEPFSITVADCGFTDGIDDTEYGTRSIAVYKNTSKLVYIYETASGFEAISKRELLVRLGKTALATHRPVIKYSAVFTETTPHIDIGDRVTVRSDRFGAYRAATVISLRYAFDGKSTVRTAVLRV